MDFRCAFNRLGSSISAHDEWAVFSRNVIHALVMNVIDEPVGNERFGLLSATENMNSISAPVPFGIQKAEMDLDIEEGEPFVQSTPSVIPTDIIANEVYCDAGFNGTMNSKQRSKPVKHAELEQTPSLALKTGRQAYLAAPAPKSMLCVPHTLTTSRKLSYSRPKTGAGPLSTSRTKTGNGPLSSSRTKTGAGPLSTSRSKTGAGPLSTSRSKSGNGPLSTSRTKTGNGPLSSSRTKTGNGPLSTSRTKTDTGPLSTSRTKTGNGPLSSAGSKTDTVPLSRTKMVVATPLPRAPPGTAARTRHCSQFSHMQSHSGRSTGNARGVPLEIQPSSHRDRNHARCTPEVSKWVALREQKQALKELQACKEQERRLLREEDRLGEEKVRLEAAKQRTLERHEMYQSQLIFWKGYKQQVDQQQVVENDTGIPCLRADPGRYWKMEIKKNQALERRKYREGGTPVTQHGDSQVGELKAKRAGKVGANAFVQISDSGKDVYPDDRVETEESLSILKKDECGYPDDSVETEESLSILKKDECGYPDDSVETEEPQWTQRKNDEGGASSVENTAGADDCPVIKNEIHKLESNRRNGEGMKKSLSQPDSPEKFRTTCCSSLLPFCGVREKRTKYGCFVRGFPI